MLKCIKGGKGATGGRKEVRGGHTVHGQPQSIGQYRITEGRKHKMATLAPPNAKREKL